MSKKFFIAIVIIFFTSLLAFFLHSISSSEKFVFGNKKEEATNNATEVKKESEDESLIAEDKTAEIGKIYKLIDGEEGSVKGAVLNKTTAQILYYQNRNFLLVDFKGQARDSIGAYPFIDVSDIRWNLNRDKALVKDKGQYVIYDLNKNTVSELDKDIDYAVWYKNSSGEGLVCKVFDDETKKRKIIILDDKGENEQIILEEAQYRKFDFKIPSTGNKICYHGTPDANFQASLDCVDIQNKQVETLHSGVFAGDYLWSNNGNRLLVSYVNEQMGGNINISSMNAKGGELRSLNFPTTVKKCVWSRDNKSVYCAMMSFGEKNVTLPNDWSSGKYNSTDTFWQIDLDSGKKRRLMENSQMVVVDAENLFLDEGERNLFFTDKITKSVYSISLK